eukprot:GILK01003068.1.p1 GENE.GILK01003068.1~~GILK01003068.1.p1  ORF type:complete len:495 (-),score=79.96 GILK01003068.1:101-1585(-)
MSCMPGVLRAKWREERRRKSGKAPMYSAFKSKVSRFEFKNEEAPGPGSYSGINDWSKRPSTYHANTSELHSKDKNVKWLRVTSAPSIPAPGQSYGYEEGPNGQLVQQKNPEYVHNGTHQHSVGPGQYRGLEQWQPRKGVDFGRSPSRTLISSTVTQETPGPGYYVYEGGAAPTTSALPPKTSSVFKSRVTRDIAKTKEEEVEAPGPGAYQIPGTFRVEKKPEKHQFFGSTSDRWMDKPEFESIPGPGQYESVVSSINVKKNLAWAQAPFQTTTQRFNINSKTKGVSALPPGPGAYEKPSMAAELTKRVWGRSGAFGSTEKRFHVASQDNLLTPGPGQYQNELNITEDATVDSRPVQSKSKSIHGVPNNKQSPMFASSSQRFLERPHDAAPPPGAYDPNINVTRSHGAIIPRSDRFKRKVGDLTLGMLGVVEETPGPGSYSVTAQQRKPLRSTQQFLTSANRFSDHRPQPIPGPGTYELRNEQSFQKRSFNTIFT